MRWVWGWTFLAASVVAGCGEDAPCGIDGDGDIIPVCIYTDADDDPMFCPNDQWVSADGCSSCGCGPDGEIICTDDLFCGGAE